MASTIQIKRSTTPSAIPADASLSPGELAINLPDNKLYSAYANGDTFLLASGTAGGITSLLDDTTPQLGGNLDLNSSNITGTGNISITGGATLSGVAALNGGITVDTTNFTVDGTTGAVATASTLDVAGVASLNGGIQVDANTFVVHGTTGAVTTASTLNVGGLASLDGGIDVDGVFTVADATGAIGTSGTLTVTNATTSTTTGTGAVIITGGVGIGENLNVGGNLTLTGDLTINGTTTIIESTTVAVDDSLLKLAANNNNADTLDVGWYAVYNSTGVKYGGVFRDASDGIFKVWAGLTAEPTSTVNLGSGALAQLDAVIDGGTY